MTVYVEDDPLDLTKPRDKQDWQLELHFIGYPRTTSIWQRLKQSVSNLLVNALKLTSPGGAVALHVLQDSGLGIGLALVSQLVRLHGGGTLEAFGAGPGPCSTFTIRRV